MWLLNAKTLTLQFFLEDVAPPYAILSHTWGDAEITFTDVQDPQQAYKQKEGWTKVEKCCRQALQDGFEYVWIDTCCIDKSSSAELQEAINSMFRWYRRSQVCYAYLADIKPGDDPVAEDSDFRRARWYTRGWTLQELIAPRLLIFFNVAWEAMGTRYGLRSVISAITGISASLFEGSPLNASRALRNASIAQKMSWASGRSTTRSEDTAYCLLGIFDVNMPMLYGEGTKAFTRLQEEIMKSSDDQSILAWGLGKPLSEPWGTSHELATSPDDFAACSNLVSFGAAEPGDSFSMTQRGLELHLPIIDLHDNGMILYCLLNCAVAGNGATVDRLLVLPLLQSGAQRSLSQNKAMNHTTITKKDEYTRMSLEKPLWIPIRSLRGRQRKTLYLPRLQLNKQLVAQFAAVHMEMKKINIPAGYSVAGIWPPAVAGDDLLQHSFQRIAPPPFDGCVMIHIARAFKPGFILIMAYNYRPLKIVAYNHRSLQLPEPPNMSRPESKPESRPRSRSRSKPGPDWLTRTVDTVRSAAATVAGVAVETLAGDSKLAELGIDSLAGLEMVHLLRVRLSVPVYTDGVLGCLTLADVARNIMRPPSAPQNSTEYDDASQGTLRRGIQNVVFSLATVGPDTSLLEFVSVSREKPLSFRKPRESKESHRLTEIYETNLAFGSDMMANVVLEADVALSRFSLSLTESADSRVMKRGNYED
ncbi:HET-domain-containing protein [Hypoxylon rubiginosum]|uniref:HET-domain-containing protein n=1 Tax=Hypoxylon rubiginosum TaxID=110542 RepID=A0ACC0D1H7_9PEZI|nr:HET-domain-containing protein [Hypoxylon rubiginosum]